MHQQSILTNIPDKMVGYQITFEQCKHVYLKNKQIIDKFMIQTILYEFSDQSQKYTSYLNHIFAIIYDQSQYILNEQVQDPFDEILEQYLIIIECKDVFLKYIQNERVTEINQGKIDEVKFYLFKVTYLFCLQSQRNQMFCLYQAYSDEIQSLIFYIIDQTEKLRQHYKQTLNLSQQKNEKQYEKSFDQQELMSSQTFNFTQIFQSYNIENKEYILKRSSKLLKEEEEFLEDFLDCLQLKGEDINIINYKKDKENLFFYAQYSFERQEKYNNLVDKYQLGFFKFFDKYIFFYFIADSSYIKQLCQDEIVLLFYIFSALYLVKYNIQFINLENCLYQLIKKLDSFKDLQQKLGIRFTLKLIKDLKEKEYLEEDIYELFTKWDTNEYVVSSNWLNKELIQFYINTAQSFIKLAIIPDLARFFFMKNQQIPFQISNHEFSFVQQIIRGKLLYLQNPDQFDHLINYWKNLKLQLIQLQVFSNQQIEKERKSISLKICEININMCEILQLEYQNNDINLEKLNQPIFEFVDLIHCSQYQNIYRKRQLFYTLQSLFIKDEIVIPIIIKKIKYQQNFNLNYNDYQIQDLLLLSIKNDIDIKYYIHQKQKLSSISNSNCKEFLILIQRYYYARELPRISLEEKKIALKEFSNIIQKFGILNTVQFIQLKQNIKFEIKKIDLQIELKSNKPQNIIQYKYLFCLRKSQFSIDRIDFNGRQLVRKKIENFRVQNDQMVLQDQIINEISILCELQILSSHKNIIKLIDYQIINGNFELFLEYCQNGSLDSFLVRNILNHDQKITICLDILEGVQHLHEHNILHGDLKLSNLVVDSNGMIKIIDFGVSTQLVKKCKFYTQFYRSYDIQQSLYYDYFSLGMILFSVLLQDVRFPQKYYTLNKGQHNKKSLKQFISQIQYDQKEKIEEEYSPSILKEILNLFNDQPFLRPKLSKLIQTLKNHLNKQNQIIKNVELKYSFKEALNNLKNLNQDSKLIHLIIEKNFIRKPTIIKKKFIQPMVETTNITDSQYNQIQLSRINFENEITLNKNKRKQYYEIIQQVTQLYEQTNQISQQQQITQNESQKISILNTKHIGSTELQVAKQITKEQFKEKNNLFYIEKFNSYNLKFYFDLQKKFNELQNKLKKKEINQKKIEYWLKEPPLCKSLFQIDLVVLDKKWVVRKSIKQGDMKEDFDELNGQLLNECALLLQLESNQNIIKLINYQINNGQIELFFEYCQNGSLFSFLRDNNELQKNQKINICLDLLKGVQFLHKHGILHGDLKLSNLVVDSNGMVKIIDFGTCSYLNKQSQYYTEIYKSDDLEKSLFNDYFSIGIILLSILLKDISFAKNYNQFKKDKIQNKKLMLDYFNQVNNRQQRQQLEKEYSPSLFSDILEIFNDQPNMRPKLLYLIKIFEDHKKTQYYQEMKYCANNSIKEATEKLTNLTFNLEQIIIIKETDFNTSFQNLMEYFYKMDQQYNYDTLIFKIIRQSKFNIRKFQIDFYELFFHNNNNGSSFIIQLLNSLLKNNEFYNILQDAIGQEQIITLLQLILSISSQDKDIDTNKINVLNQIQFNFFRINKQFKLN